MWRITCSPSGPYFRKTCRTTCGSPTSVPSLEVVARPLVGDLADLVVEDEALVLQHLGDVAP